MAMHHIERAKKWISGELPPPPIAQLIGFRPVAIDVEKGEVTLEFEATEKHTNPMGTLHGGSALRRGGPCHGHGFRGQPRGR